MEDGAQPKPGMEEQFVHKNRLQKYAQRAAISLPVYQTVNEGSQHAPQFRSTVVIDGATVMSPCTFRNRRAAEQYVAKFALESISRTIKHEGIPLIHNDTIFCKSILHEYAIKMKLEKPTYSTTQSEGLLPLFITSVIFDGETYVGGAGKNKKEAEQIAARTVIEWILGHSTMRIVMSEVIKSKGRLYNAIHKGSSSFLNDRNMSVIVPTENHSASAVVKGNDVQAALTNDELPVIRSIPSEARKTNEGNICEICSKSTGSGRTLPTLLQNNQLACSTTRPLNSISKVSYPATSIQVKIEVPSDDPPMLQNDSQSMNTTSSGKHSCKKNEGGSHPKKVRTAE